MGHNPLFIVFEGIDGSGKTTLAKSLAKSKDLIYTREPTFSSEEADRLNLKEKDSIGREVEFLIDRIYHQDLLGGCWIRRPGQVANIVCDRYIWSGLAYCHKYSPEIFDFVAGIYNHSFFKKPDIYVFVDTPIEECMKRGKVQNQDELESLRKSYEHVRPMISNGCCIITISGIGDIDTVVEDIWGKIV